MTQPRKTSMARLRRYITSLPMTQRITSASVARALDMERPATATYLARLERQGVLHRTNTGRPVIFRRADAR
jgi:DNA-binding IclR family transcriptional regulator